MIPAEDVHALRILQLQAQEELQRLDALVAAIDDVAEEEVRGARGAQLTSELEDVQQVVVLQTAESRVA